MILEETVKGSDKAQKFSISHYWEIWIKSDYQHTTRLIKTGPEEQCSCISEHPTYLLRTQTIRIIDTFLSVDHKKGPMLKK